MTTHVDGSKAVDALDGPPAESAPHPGPLHGESALARVWRFLISMRTGLIVILILGFLTLIGTLVMQATPETLADPAVYDTWLNQGPAQKYGAWTPIFSALGLFGVFHTWYFKALFAFLALSILACSINRAPRLWHTATAPKLTMGDSFYQRAPLRETLTVAGDSEAVAARVRTALSKGRFRVLDAPVAPASEGATRGVYADKFRWAPFGTVLAHLSFVVILAGFVVSGTMGFKDTSFIAPVGTPVAVGHDTGLTVVAHSFHDAYYEDGTPKDYVSDLEVSRDGTSLKRQETRVNTPLIVDDVWFHQSFFGVGADIKATKDGQELHAGLVPLDYTSDDGTQVIGKFTLDGGKTGVYVVQAASGKKLADLPPGSVGIEVHQDGAADVEGRVVSQGKSVEIGGVTYTFERNRQFTGLTVKRDPGSPLVWIGSTLLMLGSVLVFFFPHRRVWTRITDNGDGTSRVEMASMLRRDPAFEPLFRSLVRSIDS